MLRSNLFARVQKVLCLGAHSDDIEIGCGGTILRMIEQNPAIEITWVIFSGNETRAAEARSSASAFLRNAAKSTVVVHEFRDAHFPTQSSQIKERFEELKRNFTPDVIFTHRRDDRHQDHRTICELTWNTWRDHLVLEYEIPKYDGDLGHPNAFVPIDESTLRTKTRLLLEHFKSQLGRQWFTEDGFTSLPRMRGIECNSPTRFAEAFHGHKLVL